MTKEISQNACGHLVRKMQRQVTHNVAYVQGKLRVYEAEGGCGGGPAREGRPWQDSPGTNGTFPPAGDKFAHSMNAECLHQD